MFAAVRDGPYPRPLHPAHAALVAGAVPLFLGALLCDIAYSASYELQWKNFASWLLVGALVFAGCALLWAFIDLARSRRRTVRLAIYAVLLALAWVLGFINALVHAKDAWASMPEALILSALSAVLVVAAMALGLSTWRTGPAVERERLL